MSGCLDGVRVLELGGKGPVPFAGMLLADLGATVLACRRLQDSAGLEGVDVLSRGKQALRLDLKSPEVRDALLASTPSVDVVLEGFRPGVVERLGLGPADFMAANPSVVYARMSAYGQGNSYSQVAGHDINLIAMASALGEMGPADGPPAIPLNLVGDFGGGGMVLAFGVLAALVERARSGLGQTIDAAMTDSVALLMAGLYGMKAGGQWSSPPGNNLVDGGAPFYNVYATSDGRWVTIGAIEAAQWAEVQRVTGVAGDKAQHDQLSWPGLRAQLATAFRTKTSAEWAAAFAGVDACFATVLTMDDAPDHEYHLQRGTFPVIDGVTQPAPAPRFSRTPSSAGRLPSPDADVIELLRLAGFTEASARGLSDAGLAAV